MAELVDAAHSMTPKQKRADIAGSSPAGEIQSTVIADLFGRLERDCYVF